MAGAVQLNVQVPALLATFCRIKEILLPETVPLAVSVPVDAANVPALAPPVFLTQAISNPYDKPPVADTVMA